MALLHPKMYKRPAKHALKIINGSGTGNRYPLFLGEPVTIGKGTSCDISLDVLSDNVSFKHARITARDDIYLVENISQTHSVLVNGQPVEEKQMVGNERFQLHDISFLFEEIGFEVPKQKKKKKKKKSVSGEAFFNTLRRRFKLILFFVLLLFLCSFFLLLRGKSEKKPIVSVDPITEVISGETSVEEPSERDEINEREKSVKGNKEKQQFKVKNSEVEEIFRQGLLFYNNNDFKNAVRSWQETLKMSPAHQRAQQMLEKAKTELDLDIEQHYQKGLKAVKYMRNEEAIKEFEIVREMAIDENDRRLIGARQQLQSLKNE